MKLATYILTSDLADAVEESVSKNFITFDKIKTYLVGHLPSVVNFVFSLIIAIIVLLVGIRVIKLVRKIARKAMKKTSLDRGLQQFLDHLLNLLLYFVLIMIILGTFGITASAVIAIIGSAGLSIGLALQGTLSNFAGGVLILLLKPFKVGDYIYEDTHGNEGIVKEIQLFYTKLVTIDNKTVVLPNGTLSNTSLINYTHQGKRMVEIKTGISYHSDLKLAKDMILNTAMKDPDRLQEDICEVFVSELADSSVIIGLRFWVSSENYWHARWRVIEKIKYALDEAEIEIPFPQMDVSIRNVK